MRGWTLSEKIEIAIYKELERVNRGQPHATNVSKLNLLVPSSQQVDVTDALLRLERGGFICLDKYVPGGGSPMPLSSFPSPDSLLYGPPYGDFRITLTPEGRSEFEKRALQQPLVFISCGQWHEHEKMLGQKLLAAVNQTAPLRGYFAEYQSSLSNLSRHIFEALDTCVAIVAVLHKRGTIDAPTGMVTRASVWIEQEIAIAAFLTDRLQRNIEIAAYIEKGIDREGLRSQLILNPIEFEKDEQVLEHFQTLLPAWKTLVT